MKKKAKKIAAAFLSAALAATAVESTGYRMLDRADGGNFLCERDSSCRPLTPGEIELARTIFGDTLDYRKIKIFSRAFFHWPTDEPHSPNGNLYFPDDEAPADFSKADLFYQQVFIHEMVHAAQDARGIDVPLAAAVAYIENRGNYKAAYSFKGDLQRDFMELNLEQQAEIVEAFFRARARLHTPPKDYSAQERKEDRETVETLYPKIAPYFPVKKSINKDKPSFSETPAKKFDIS